MYIYIVDGTVRASLNDTDEPQDGHTDPAPSNDDDNRDKDNQQGAEDVTEGDEEFESTTFSSQSGAAFVAQNAKVLVFVVCFFVAVANHVAKHPGDWKRGRFTAQISVHLSVAYAVCCVILRGLLH